VRRAQRQAGLRQSIPTRSPECQRDPEIAHHRLARLKQDVLGFDVAMDHALRMRVVERLGHVGGDPHGLVHRKLVLSVQPVPQALPLDVWHHVEEEAIRLARVEERKDVRVLEVGGRLDLGEEPFGTDHRRQLRLQHLERDLAVVLEVLGQVDRGHPSRTELALDAVAALQGCVQAGGGIGRGLNMRVRCPLRERGGAAPIGA
jgi:hypothetical protein